MTDRAALKGQLQRAVEKVTRRPVPAGWDVAPASLVDTLYLDSLAILELVLTLEEALDIEIPDEDVAPEMFDSADALIDYLAARLEGSR